MSPLFCRSCIGMGLLISGLVHGLALSLVLNLERPIPVSQAEEVTELDLSLFATTVPSEPPASPDAPQSPPESEAVAEPEPEPDPEPEQVPAPVVAAEEAIPPPVRKPKPRLPPKHEKRPERQLKNARAAVPAPGPPKSDAPAGPAAVASEQGSASGRLQAEAAYLAELQRAIKRQQRYPEGARHRGAVGMAVLTFVLQADGRIDRVQVAQSSGDTELDQAAVQALNRLGHFKPIPLVIGRTSWTLRIPIRFDLG